MDLKNPGELREPWQSLLKRLSEQFGTQPDLQAVIYLIGIQELGKGPGEFTKSEKQDLMHIGTCRLLSTYGYYIFSGRDEEGWPHWELVEHLPRLTLKEQDQLLKRAALLYFEKE